MEIGAHSLDANAPTEIPKIDEKELGALCRKASPAGPQEAGKPSILAVLSNAVSRRLSPMNRRFNAFTLLEATEGSPTLAGLAARARDSSERLAAILDLIPPELRSTVKAGPAEGDVWCMLVSGSAAAAKLRQLAPSLQSRLRSCGWNVATIRIKVQSRH